MKPAETEWHTCPVCRGTGSRAGDKSNCPECNGKGRINAFLVTCSECDGKGYWTSGGRRKEGYYSQPDDPRTGANPPKVRIEYWVDEPYVNHTCSRCGGHSVLKREVGTCEACKGTGQIESLKRIAATPQRDAYDIKEVKNCSTCEGKGEYVHYYRLG